MRKKKRGIKIQKYSLVVCCVRLGFFLLLPELFAGAFTGVKELVIHISKAESLEWTTFTGILVFLIAVTVCFGRVFCGFACAFGTYGDFLYFVSSWLRKKKKRQPFHVFSRWQNGLKYLKYIVLFGILVICALGYSNIISENSPWTAFSRFYAGKFPNSKVSVVLLLIISVGMCLEPRFFCRFLCPMGALFSMLPVLPWAVPKRSKKSCLKGCSLCKRTCPAAIEIPDAEEDDEGMGECFSCYQCMRKCPKKNISLTNVKS